MSTSADRERVLGEVQILMAAYSAGLLGGTHHEVFPDVPASSAERRLYFTLAPALNYQRKSELLWRSALLTYDDPETRFVFFPANVVKGRDSYAAALTKYSLAIQPAKQVDIWYRLSETFSGFGNDPIGLFEQCDYEVERVREYIVANKAMFPYLGGPKLLNYWLYMLTCFTDIPLRGREAISVVPDVHVRRATAVLGLTEREDEAAESVAALWYSVLAGTGLSPVDVHAPLWRWSRAGFPSTDGLRKSLYFT